MKGNEVPHQASLTEAHGSQACHPKEGWGRGRRDNCQTMGVVLEWHWHRACHAREGWGEGRRDNCEATGVVLEWQCHQACHPREEEIIVKRWVWFLNGTAIRRVILGKKT